MEATRPKGSGYGLVAVALFISLSWVGMPLLDGSGVYLGKPGFWGVAALTLGFYCILAWSLVRIAFGRAFLPMKRFGPIALQLAAIALTWATDVESIATRWNFRSRMAARVEVVEMVRSGDLAISQRQGDVRPTVELPAKYRSLSAGGRIAVTHHADGISVTFYVKRTGMFPDDDYTAFIYRSGPGEPSSEVEDTDRFVRVTALSPHWFFVVHT